MKKAIVFMYELFCSLVYAMGKRPFEIRRMESPPQVYKHRVIRHYARKYRCTTFIETGTYRGETTRAVKDCFKEVHTVEVLKSLYFENRKSFKNDKKVHCWLGDSHNVLGEMIDRVNNKERILFFLDGHYSGKGTGMGLMETPIMKEIDTIFCKLSGKYHFVVLIDDARCFTGEHDYPVLDEFVRDMKARKGVHIIVKSDIIRIVV